VVLAGCVLVVGLMAAGAARQKRPDSVVPTAAVERQDIVVTVEANGTIEPINVVDVKSKASGQIVRMPVEIGSIVSPGDLLVQIDQRDVQNQYDQTLAALRVAEVRAEVAAAQRQRADQLFAQQIITAQEHETSLLDHENAQAQLVKARTDLDLARQRLEDATVRAPIAGTVIDKPVSVGQVISSATSSVSGGTSLLQMADLKKIRLRSLVNETDIGNVKPDQPATVVVDAYPDRQFRGFVEKVEPRALVEQSVTMFPVLVSISNDEGLLMPGMNGEVTLLVERQDDVLAVPVDAVRSARELTEAAAALGLDPDSLRARMRADGGRRSGDSTVARTARVDGVRNRGGAQNRGDGQSRGGAQNRGGSQSRGGAQARIVFVKTAGGFVPRYVRLGVSNYDYAQVLSGLDEGESVALLSAAQLQRQREQSVQRMRQRIGGALPGVQSQPGGGGRAGGGRQ
jgi:HlyD family secretion protein